jgi:hypothetical protein
VLEQLKQMEEFKRIIYEYERRDKLRANEWNALTEENTRLRLSVSDLQNMIHRQMSDVHIMLSQKEQKLNLWMTKTAELATGGNEMRKRAAEFLVSQLQEGDMKQSEYLTKLDETKRQLAFVEIANNELKLEINQLKDKIQYSDPNHIHQEIQTLKDKIHQLTIQGSVQKLQGLYKYNDALMKKLHYLEESEHLLRDKIIQQQQQTSFVDDSCINYLERLLQEREAELESYKSKQVSFTKDNPIKMMMMDRTRKVNDLRDRTLKVLEEKTFMEDQKEAEREDNI